MRSGFVCERYFYNWHVGEVYSYLGMECSDVRIEFIKRAQHEIRINHALFPFLYIFGCNSQIIDTNHLLDTFVLQNNSLLEIVHGAGLRRSLLFFAVSFFYKERSYISSARRLPSFLKSTLVLQFADVHIFPSVLPQLFSLMRNCQILTS